MSGLPYQGGLNSYMFDTSQYGVNSPQSDPNATAGKLASLIPFIGPMIGAAGNIASVAAQNFTQERFFNEYMSPQARMAQMRAAGINPNAAAQGISGSAAPQMNAASPTGVFSALGEQLGNSVNTALSADVIRSEARKNNAEADLTDSMNVEKTITNKYLDAEHTAALNKLVSEGEISRSTANMIKVDEAYKGVNAYANYQQLLLNLEKTGTEISHLESQIVHEYASAYQAMMQGNLAKAEIQKVFSDIGLNNAMISRIEHEIPKIDAETASIYQDIDESEARTMALDIQNKFQKEYFDIWQNTGFNWNSDIEKSIVYSASNFQVKDAERMLNGLNLYITSTGDARSQSNDYVYDKLFGLFGDVLRFGGLIGGAKVVSSGSPEFRRGVFKDNRGGTVHPGNLIQR